MKVEKGDDGEKKKECPHDGGRGERGRRLKKRSKKKNVPRKETKKGCLARTEILSVKKSLWKLFCRRRGPY